jgi:hypothetical protein
MDFTGIDSAESWIHTDGWGGILLVFYIIWEIPVRHFIDWMQWRRFRHDYHIRKLGS